MRKNKCLKETTHRRTYNLVRKETYAICSRCSWHPTFWRWCGDNPFIYMTYKDDGTNKPYASRFKNHPNWKIVSKNKKQWMKKRFLEKRAISPDGRLLIEYGW